MLDIWLIKECFSSIWELNPSLQIERQFSNLSLLEERTYIDFNVDFSPKMLILELLVRPRCLV